MASPKAKLLKFTEIQQKQFKFEAATDQEKNNCTYLAGCRSGSGLAPAWTMGPPYTNSTGLPCLKECK